MPGAKPPRGESGLEQHIAGLLCYLFPPVVAVIFLIVEKKNREIRFHAWQGMLLGCTLIGGHLIFWLCGFLLGYVAGFLTTFFSFLIGLLWLGVIIGGVLAMVQAYQGGRFYIPVLGEIADYQSKKENA